MNQVDICSLWNGRCVKRNSAICQSYEYNDDRRALNDSIESKMNRLLRLTCRPDIRISFNDLDQIAAKKH